MWILWFALVATVSCTTLFLIWFSEGWRNFNKSFMDLNNNIFSAGENIIPTLISIYPYVASFFGLTLAGGIILNAIGKKKYPERKSFFKKRLVLSIILTCVFAVFVVFDIFFFVKTI